MSTNSALRDPHEWGGHALLRLSFQLLPELVFLQHVGASVRIPKAERLHTDVELGVHEKPFEHAGMEPAYDRRPAADLGEEAVVALDDAAAIRLVLGAHLEHRLEGRHRGLGARKRDRFTEVATGSPHRVAPDVAQLVECAPKRFSHDVVPPHRMADLHRSARQLVDLRRLAGESAPVSDFKVAECNQAFQVLEGNRAMNTSLAGNIFHAARLAVRIEAEQDVAPGEIAQSAERGLPVS